MNKNLKSYFEELTKDVQDSYSEGVTLETAERLAAKFLGAQITTGEELRKADLDARMRKSGVKALKAAVYLDNATKSEKKPTEATLSALVDSDSMVNDEQTRFDTAEVERNALENYLSIFREAHVYYRGVAKGRFE